MVQSRVFSEGLPHHPLFIVHTLTETHDILIGGGGRGAIPINPPMTQSVSQSQMRNMTNRDQEYPVTSSNTRVFKPKYSTLAFVLQPIHSQIKQEIWSLFENLLVHHNRIRKPC